MSVPAYKSYKPSGVFWLGDVPAHWELKRLAHYFEERREKCSDTEFPALSVTKNGIVPQLENAAKTDDGDNRKKVLAGDFVINSRSDRKGSSGLSILSGSVSLINTVLTPFSPMLGKYSHHLFRSASFQEEYYRYGKGIVADLWSTNYSEMRNILLAVPPPPEQSAIVTFLDRETGKIDALVEEQRRLIELLKEKRQAVISHAVTKGLDPLAPMIDSGVGWLGKIPARWDVKRLKYLSPAITVGIVVNPSAYLSDDGLPFLYGGDISEGRINTQDARRIRPEVSATQPKTMLRAGDLVTVRVGAPGVTAVVTPECEGGNCASVMLVRKGPYSSSWLCHAMNSRHVRYQVEVVQYGAAQEQFNIGHAVNFLVVTPPPEETVQIAAYIERTTATIDALASEARAAVKLLQERRGALISAAVTGKIDVRDLAPAEAEAA